MKIPCLPWNHRYSDANLQTTYLRETEDGKYWVFSVENACVRCGRKYKADEVFIPVPTRKEVKNNG